MRRLGGGVGAALRRFVPRIPVADGTEGTAEFGFDACRGHVEIGQGFTADNVIVAEAGLGGLPAIRILRQGAPGGDLSGCRLHFATGASGSYTIRIGPDPAHMRVGVDTRCVLDLRLWRRPVLEIGAGTTINGCRIVVDDASVVIGPDCLLSDEILLQAGDQHGLIDLASMQLTNARRRRIEIGAHVWLGRRSIVMPDVSIGAGSVVGAGAIVTADAPTCSYIVGVPARVVRQGASWTRSPGGPSPQEAELLAKLRDVPSGSG